MSSRQSKVLQPEKPRIAYLDIAKAIGIILVVFAHINVKGPIYQTIYSFHMPLFFIIAGITFKSTEPFGVFLKKKALRLMLPYIVYSLITFVWYALVEVKMPEFTALTRNQTVAGAFLEIFLARGSVDFLQHNPALWFIPCLFATELIYYGISKLKKPLKIASGLLLGAVGCIFTLDFMPQILRELPLQIEVAFIAIPFLMVGEFFAKHNPLQTIRSKVLAKKTTTVTFYVISTFAVILSLAAVVGLTFLNNTFIKSETTETNNADSMIDNANVAAPTNAPDELVYVPEEELTFVPEDGEATDVQPDITEEPVTETANDFAKKHVSMGQKHLGNFGIFYVNAIIGSFAILLLSVLLEGLLAERIALHKSWLVWLGERSYDIMAIHYPVKRRMVVIVAQAINAWHLYPITGKYTTFTSENLLPSFIAFIFTMFITIIITISARAFVDNAQWRGRSRKK